MRILTAIFAVSLSSGLLQVPLARAQTIHAVPRAHPFTFTKVVDTSTPIPGGGVGSFTEFNPPSISNGEVVFIGLGSSGQVGIYRWKDGILSTAVDRGTPIPGGTGTFSGFGRSSLHSGAIAFNAGTQVGVNNVRDLGIYSLIDGTLDVVVNTSTEMPGSPGLFFQSFGVPWIYDGSVVFMGGNAAPDPTEGGVYLQGTEGLVRIAGIGTDIPDGGSFTDFPFTDRAPTLDDGDVAFWASGVRDSHPVDGVYVSEAGTLKAVNEFDFDSGGSFEFSRPLLSDGKVTYGRFMNFSPEIARKSVNLPDFERLYDRRTQVPGRVATFNGLGLQRSGEGPSVSFLGGATGQQGIYTDINGRLEEVIHDSDTLDGKTGLSMGHYAEGTSRNQVVFLVVNFSSDGSRGIFIATSTLCGDGFVNPNTEECDDGNAVTGDGCSSCRLDVCGDVNDSGAVDPADVARLRAHLAAPGSQPLSDEGRQKCPVIEPEACDIGAATVLRRALRSASLPPGIAPVCPFIAALLPQGGLCSSNAECASGFCTEGICCDSACLNECESCLATDTSLADGSCALRSSAIEVCDGVDNDCDLVADEPDTQDCSDFFVDGDGDGFGDPGDHACLCSAADPHTVANADDCYDLNANARPTQTAFIPIQRGDGSFDYNCDGIEERELRRNGSCLFSVQSQACILTSGWLGSSVPACGVDGRRILGCQRIGAISCQTLSVQDVQACR